MDTTNVGIAHLAYAGQCRRELDKGLRRISALKKIYEFSGLDVPGRLGVARNQLPLIQGNEMRNKAQATVETKFP